MPNQDPESTILAVLQDAPRGQEARLLAEKGEELRLQCGSPGSVPPAPGPSGKALDVALGCFDRALRYDVTLPEAWVGRSRVLSAKQRDNEALGCVNRALDTDPRFGPALLQKAEIMRGRGQNEEALALYEAALGAGEGERARVGRAEVMRALGRSVAPPPAAPPPTPPPPARISISPDPLVARKSDPALSLGPGARQSVPPKRPSGMSAGVGSGAHRRVTQAEADLAIVDEVRALVFEKRYVEAFRKLEPLAQRMPSKREPWLLRGQILLALGKFDVALTSAERVLKNDPKDSDATILAIRALQGMGKDVKAMEVADRLVTFAESSVEVLRVRADCLVLAMRQAEAVSVYEKVLELAPDDASCLLAFGKTLRQLRRAREARALLERAASLADASGDAALAAQAREVLAKIPPVSG